LTNDFYGKSAVFTLYKSERKLTDFYKKL
jgi:hypothetical protein